MKAKAKSAGRKELTPGLVFWGVWMTMVEIILILSLILIINQETPLFAKGHIAEECIFISSIINLGLGINYFITIRKSLPGETD